MAQARAGAAERGEDRVGPAGVGAPGLRGVVRRPAVHEHAGAVGEQPAGDREADAGAPAHAGDEGDAVVHAAHWYHSGR